MKHNDYRTIIEAAQKLTGSKAQTKEGAWRALKPWIASRPAMGSGPYYGNYPTVSIARSIAERNGMSLRDGYCLARWRQRADRGAEKITRANKLKSRWEDLTSKRPRDPWNRAVAKTRRGLARDQYGALYMERIDTSIAPWEGVNMERHIDREAKRICDAWLNTPQAAPAGLNDAWKCVRDIEANTDEHGGWERRSEWDDKGRGEQVTVDLYGIDAAARLYVIQVRQSFRPHKNWYLSVRKSYFMIGYNENGNPFAHAISSGVVHGAIKRDPAPESPVRAAQAWIWGIDESKLPAVLRNGDVALVPAKCPQKEVAVYSGGEYRVDDGVASDHHLIADEVRANGAIYAKNPTIYHRKGQHPAAHGEGWFKVVVGRRADFWSFARPTVD